MMDPLPKLNSRLIGADNDLFPQPRPARCVFVVGCPRSGTTLMSQILASRLDVGYIDNLAAAFWESPALGVLLSRKLIQSRDTSGRSSFGATENLSEPHEFGGFWRSQLGYTDMLEKEEHAVDWNSLLHSLGQIGEAWERPLMFKVFQLFWHAAEFQSLAPSTKWIWVNRDAYDNVASLHKFYKQRNVENEWLSAVPLAALKGPEPSTLIDRCTQQIFHLKQSLEDTFCRFSSNAVIRVELDALIENPDGEFNRLSEFLEIEPRHDLCNLALLSDVINASKPAPTDMIAEIREVYSRLEKDQSCD